MKLKKWCACFITAAMVLGTTGCSNEGTEMEVGNQTTANTEKIEGDVENKPVTITIGKLPNKDQNPESYENEMELTRAFMEKYPYITVERTEYDYSVDTFMALAATNQLPSAVLVPFTELNKIIDAGYAAEITSWMNELGYIDALKETALEAVSREDAIYFLPNSFYTMGMAYNWEVLEEAGEIKEDGTFEYPKTWEEFAELGARIREKTGKAGLSFPTTGNCGGWHFMNIAWGFGVDFITQENGKWVASFDGEEGVQALQFFKDLKWKYDIFCDNVFVDQNEAIRMYSAGEAAALMSAPGRDLLKPACSQNKMNPESVAVGAMPAGNAGQYALSGGNAYMISSSCTEEQIDAVFKWFEYTGAGLNATESNKQAWENKCKANIEAGIPNLPFEINTQWKSGEAIETRNAIYEKYADLGMEKHENYLQAKQVIAQTEEAVCCQELYSLLDSVVQAVLSDENADVQKLLSDCAKELQVNYLDNLG